MNLSQNDFNIFLDKRVFSFIDEILKHRSLVQSALITPY
jgi:hypothetical protein